MSLIEELCFFELNFSSQFSFNESNDELPLRSHFVCYTPESILENKKVQNAVQIGGFCNIMGTKDDQEEKWKDDHDMECNL